ncbi:hypothetical protein LC2W_2814 [Lacticaseibacillus paracasei]|nr:hypothetical protein LCAZH_2621 [Lacticaseibacillus paracasei]AEA55143.1 hypothetical protein LC2W_2814 [Lacticaseibacillus paracasei]AEA58334.1 hypothetical protein LCBD_2840 [Lacticaseibacillus paracasei]
MIEPFRRRLLADHKLTGLNGCGDKSEQIFTKKTTPCFTGMGRFFW